jgi:LmbE family N-acetylglucosaminyl deacetylase
VGEPEPNFDEEAPAEPGGGELDQTPEWAPDVVPATIAEEADRPTPEVAPGPVLAIFGHPDDAEICAGGTLARWAKEGRQVHLLVLTNGDRGSNDPVQDRAELARTRLGETGNAARLMGLAGFRVLTVHDGDLVNGPEVRAEVVRVIREIRPAIVVTCDPTAWFFGNRYFNHADHRTAGEIALDAVFPAAGNPHFFHEQLVDGLLPWNAPEVWLGWTIEPNHHQDVTGFMELKLAALAEHRSQVQGGMLGFFEEWLPADAREAGEHIGVEHAESFRVLNLL